MLKPIGQMVVIALLLAGCEASKDAPAQPSGPKKVAELAVAEQTPKAGNASDAEQAPAPPEPPAPMIAATCKGDEDAIFACKTANGSDLSVCANAEHVHYRFGKGSKGISLTGTQWANAAYSGGGEAQILFSNDDTNYIVFSRMVRTNFEPGEPNNPAISDGVIVMRGDEVLAVNECAGGQAEKPVDYNLAEAKLTRADELFTYETGRAD